MNLWLSHRDYKKGKHTETTSVKLLLRKRVCTSASSIASIAAVVVIVNINIRRNARSKLLRGGRYRELSL